MSRSFARALLTLLCPLAAVSAQRQDTTTVPRELAVALLAFSDYAAAGRPAIVVGRVPAEYLTSIVPRNAVVLGGVTYPQRRGGGHSAVVFSMPVNADSALTLLAAQLERSGWRPAPLPDNGGSGGFVGIGGPMMEGRVVNYCSKASSLYGSVVDGANGGAVVRINSSASLRHTQCDQEQQNFMRGMDHIPLPTLRPPPGAGGQVGGSSGGGDTREMYTELNSGLSAVDMVAHFAPQLQEQGWTLNNRASDGDVTVLTGRKTNEKGELMLLMLADNRFEARDHLVILRVWIPSRQ